MGLEEIRFNAAVVRAFVMFSRVAGWLVLALGLLTLLAWLTGVDVLRLLAGATAGMRFGAACAAVLAAGALLLAPRARSLSLALSVLLLAYAGFESIHYLGGGHEPFVRWLERWLAVEAQGTPLHMTEVATVGFALIGALGVCVASRRALWLGEACALVVIAIGTASAASYGIVLAGGSADLLNRLPLATALALLLLALAWMSSVPTRGLTRIAVADSLGGAFARRLILPSLLLPVLLTFVFELMQSRWQIAESLTLPLATMATGGAVATMIVWVAFLMDRSERQRRTVLALREDAHTDALTGVVNRRGFDQRLAALLHEHEGLATLGVLMLDLDRFKSFNDSFGHQAGDEVLRETGRLLRAEVRPRDVVARYGGEEFVVVLPDSDRERAARVGERILAAFRRHAWPLRPVTVSIGATIALAGEDPAAVLRRADEALYCSKQQGRDRLSFDGGPCQGLLASGPVMLP